MLFVGIFAALCCVALSLPPPDRCIVGEWGEWSDCKKSSIDHNVKSHPMSIEEKKLGKGHQNMKKLMALKEKARSERRRCQEDNICGLTHSPASIRGALVPCVDGMAGEYPCSNVDLLSFISKEDLGYPESNVWGNDIWVWHDEEFGEYYALMGLTHGTSFVRVTDPVNPEVVGILRTHTVDSTWRDMKVIKNFAYIVSEATDHGMQIFDLTQLRELPADPSREFETTTHYNFVTNTHNIAANPDTDTVYLIGSTRQPDCGEGINGAGGLHMVDVSDPANPTRAGCFETDGYVHDTECLIYQGPDTEHQGKEICFGYNENSLTIYDVSDKAGPDVVLSRSTYDGSAYTHQGWCTEDHRYLLLDDELDEILSSEKNTKTFVWNIEDLDAPVLAFTYISAMEAADHNLYIRENFAHQSNYEAGYRILDLSNIDNNELTEVAYFDVYPDRTTAQFNGAWSNYPWLLDAQNEQFTVVSSIDYGLYVVKPDWNAIQAEQRMKRIPKGEMNRFRDIVDATDRTKCPALVETKKCF